MRLGILFLFMICTASATAQKLTIQPTNVVRLGAMAQNLAANETSQVVLNNYFVAWNSTDNADYRVCLVYKPSDTVLNDPSIQILSARLRFNAKPWGHGRNALTVDLLENQQVDMKQMMFAPVRQNLLSDGWTAKTYDLNLVDVLRSALKTNKPFTLRFSQDNDKDVMSDEGQRVAPFGGEENDHVMIDSGCVLEALVLEVVYGKQAVASPDSELQSGKFDSKVSDQGDITVVGSLANTIAMIGQSPATLVVSPPGVYTIKSHLRIPKNIELVVPRGVILNIEPAATLTINGYLKAGPHQVFKQQGVINGEIQNDQIFPQWFGAQADGLTDDVVPLQQAVDFACTSKVLNVNLGRGKYRITKTLNCTNTRRPNRVRRDFLQIRGASFQTQIIGDTGEGYAIIDASGSQWLELQNFRIGSGSKNPSTIGLFSGASKILPQSQNQVFHLFIKMHDDMTANEGKGTIGIWNFAAEESTYHSMYVVANRPVVLTAFNDYEGDPLALNYKNAYLELLKVHSNGMNTFSGECFLNAIGCRAPAVTTNCANTVRFENTYIGSGSPGGDSSGSVVFEVYGSLVNLNYTGVAEGIATFMKLRGQLINASASVTYGGVRDHDAPLLCMGDKSRIVNSTLKFQLEANPNRNLFVLEDDLVRQQKNDWQEKVKEGQVDDIAPIAGLAVQPVEKVSLINTQIYTNMADLYLNVPEILASHSRNSVIYGANKEIRLK